MWLLDFKASIFQDPNNLLLNWSTDTDHCATTAAHWYIISYDPLSANVVYLNFTGKASRVMPPSIGNLINFRVLSLSHNSFSSHIPSELGKFEFLRTFELHGCSFSRCILD
ncbi:LRR receptor-like serine/threonine-protein kinase RPK2 [Forsythia ovata]|uniref:LRR receptor-like serine/threonine-protein kinase RPK2 n=1 Tax=Forsythia ovata TaxID=205694 RepID=A0ABD1X2R7_9LAMI